LSFIRGLSPRPVSAAGKGVNQRRSPAYPGARGISRGGIAGAVQAGTFNAIN
jgi:hypothetical protein